MVAIVGGWVLAVVIQESVKAAVVEPNTLAKLLAFILWPFTGSGIYFTLRLFAVPLRLFASPDRDPSD
ncbi:MAG: hypothetical protein OXK21_06335 [Chloroflexota bacterium]|nr:hypothetical protein [Chloroflexota bacterium]